MYPQNYLLRLVIEFDRVTLLNRAWDRPLGLIAVVSNFQIQRQKRFKWWAGSGTKLLIPVHPFAIQNFLKFAKFLADWTVPGKFKWNPKVTKDSLLTALPSILP